MADTNEQILLLDLLMSPFSNRVKIALAEKGIECESREEDLGNKSSLLLQMNPVFKQVPVLIHNGKPLCQSLVIVQYIDEVWSHKPPLLPSHPYQRAQARFWADYVDKKIYSVGRLAIETEGEEKEASKKELIGIFKLLEGELGDKTYFGGEEFGFVDVALIPFYSWFYAFETLGDMNLVEDCPKLVAWAKRCIQRDSVSKSLPDQQIVYDYFSGIKN